ncbi:ATP-binding protein [Actinokineospora sp. NPDC004072]
MSGRGDPLGAEHVSVWEFGQSVEQVAEVRRWVVGELPELVGTELLGDIQLVVTELVGNAYEHAQRPSRLRLVRLGPVPGPLRVEVDDASAAQPAIGRSRFGDIRGRGLNIVDALSVAWGVDRKPPGKTVWATFDTGSA